MEIMEIQSHVYGMDRNFENENGNLFICNIHLISMKKTTRYPLKVVTRLSHFFNLKIFQRFSWQHYTVTLRLKLFILAMHDINIGKDEYYCDKLFLETAEILEKMVIEKYSAIMKRNSVYDGGSQQQHNIDLIHVTVFNFIKYTFIWWSRLRGKIYEGSKASYAPFFAKKFSY